MEMQEIDSDMDFYPLKIGSVLCLVAVDGDKSAGALGNTNTVYLFNSKHKKYVDEFLKAQLNFKLSSWEQDFSNLKKYLNNDKSEFDEFVSAFYKLQELGIFLDKYDFRTEWDIAVYEELEITGRYQPYSIEPNSFEE